MKNKMEKQGSFTVLCEPFFTQPLGYTRTTQRMKYTDKYMKYAEWKSHVMKSFKFGCADLRVPDKQKCRLELMIYFRNNRRPDPDNVFKGVADALADHKEYGGGLYWDDKYVTGGFDFEIDKLEPRIDVDIYF